MAFSLRYVWKYHICCYIIFTRYFVSDEFGKIKNFPRKATVPKMKGISRTVESVRVGKDWSREVQLKLKSSQLRKLKISSIAIFNFTFEDRHQQLFFSEIICIPVKNTPYSCKGFIPAPRQTLELVTLDVGAQVRLHTAYCTKGSNKGQISIVRGLTLNICLGDGVHHSKRNIFQLKTSKTMRSLM